MSKSPKLIVISAPSGTGKTSVIKEILKKNSDKLIFSVSATTREKRANEIDGVDYYFLSEEEFKKKLKMMSLSNGSAFMIIITAHQNQKLKEQQKKINIFYLNLM